MAFGFWSNICEFTCIFAGIIFYFTSPHQPFRPDGTSRRLMEYITLLFFRCIHHIYHLADAVYHLTLLQVHTPFLPPLFLPPSFLTPPPPAPPPPPPPPPAPRARAAAASTR
jgi:hypothetical protein